MKPAFRIFKISLLGIFIKLELVTLGVFKGGKLAPFVFGNFV